MFTRSAVRPCSRKVSGVRSSSWSANGVGCSTWPPEAQVAAIRGAEGDPGKQGPLRASRGAARRDLAGFGGTIDLEERGTHARLDRERQLLRHGGGGRQHQLGRRQFEARRQQRLQMNRRGHQHAGVGDAATAAQMSAG